MSTYVVEQGKLGSTLAGTSFSDSVRASILATISSGTGPVNAAEITASTTAIPQDLKLAIVKLGGEVKNIPDSVPVVVFQGESVTYTGKAEVEKFIEATKGNNTISLSGNNKVTVKTGDGTDVITTAGGSDRVELGKGSDLVNTGTGIDSVKISAAKASFTIAVTGDQTGLVLRSNDGDIKFVRNAEIIEFGDGSVLVAAKDNNDGTLARLYKAAFNTGIDAEDFKKVLALENSGVGLDKIGEQFFSAAAAQKIYGGLSDDALIDALYKNFLGRDADAAGKAFWLDLLKTGYSKGKMVADFAYSPEAQQIFTDLVQIVGSIDGGTGG